MEHPISHQPHHWKEYRRFRAWDLAQQDWKQRDIALALGVAEGVEALRHRPPPGAQPKLTPDQRAQLSTLLARGAEAFGFRGAVRTDPRVAALIERTFGVRYHPADIPRLLRAIGWSP